MTIATNEGHHRGVRVMAPVHFWNLSAAQLGEICNGMGPKGYGWLVPDTMYGMDLGPAGDVHDAMYKLGLWTRLQCDKLFLENMLNIIEDESDSKILAWLRRRRAHKYYWAVRAGGASSYEGAHP